ncbi:PucR family transcriptional regulator [Aneurinibacillus tyrosinisolvens]|uniref:PucR family transcriptional regulator n=1 Tax=Aneurinibacillus tyrosinisolvens TaxID=1443435 RepID=UPI00063F9214|nr:PucR family transcriptional regulator [Aneurinibacillus tyrosinisolvens]
MSLSADIMGEIAGEIRKMVEVPVAFTSLPLSHSEKTREQRGEIFVVPLSVVPHAIVIEGMLSEREKKLAAAWIGQMAAQWKEERSEEARWLEKALDQWKRKQELSSSSVVKFRLFSEMEIYLPFVVGMAPITAAQQEWITQYFEQPVSFFALPPASNGTMFTGLLVPFSTNGELEEAELKNTVEEWGRGLQILWEEELGKQVVVGVFHPVTSIESWVQSFGEMIAEYEQYTAFYGTRQGDFLPLLAPWSYPLEKMLITLSVREREAFIRAYLPEPETARRLLEEKEWNRTIAAFLEQNLNLSETARTLHIHRNTLQYRLEKIKMVTGLDAKRFEEAVLLRILLSLLTTHSPIQHDQQT